MIRIVYDFYDFICVYLNNHKYQRSYYNSTSFP